MSTNNKLNLRRGRNVASVKRSRDGNKTSLKTTKRRNTVTVMPGDAWI